MEDGVTCTQVSKSSSSLPQQMQAQLSMLALGPVLPELDGLPGAEQQPPAAERQGEGGAGEGRAYLGGHVIGAAGRRSRYGCGG